MLAAVTRPLSTEPLRRRGTGDWATVTLEVYLSVIIRVTAYRVTVISPSLYHSSLSVTNEEQRDFVQVMR